MCPADLVLPSTLHLCLFFFNDTATTEIYTLSLHDALPIYRLWGFRHMTREQVQNKDAYSRPIDRKSTRLNSSHSQISYAVFCLKKKIYANQRPDGGQQHQQQSEPH